MIDSSNYIDFQDQIIIPLTTAELASKALVGEADEDDPMLVVHPNYTVDL